MNFAGWVIAVILAAICGAELAKLELRTVDAIEDDSITVECVTAFPHPATKEILCSAMPTDNPLQRNLFWV